MTRSQLHASVDKLRILSQVPSKKESVCQFYLKNMRNNSNPNSTFLQINYHRKASQLNHPSPQFAKRRLVPRWAPWSCPWSQCTCDQMPPRHLQRPSSSRSWTGHLKENLPTNHRDILSSPGNHGDKKPFFVMKIKL